MNSSAFMNSGRVTFAGGEIRSPRAGERSGAVSTRQAETGKIKVKTYSIVVKDGTLQMGQPPRKVRSK